MTLIASGRWQLDSSRLEGKVNVGGESRESKWVNIPELGGKSESGRGKGRGTECRGGKKAEKGAGKGSLLVVCLIREIIVVI